jgi:hypothetical protein
MNKLLFKKLLILLILFSVSVSCNSRLFNKISSRGSGRELSGSSRKSKEVKIKEPGAVRSAKKKQEAREKANKKTYFKSIDNSKKRTVEIQTPEVQARMKQNKDQITARDKAKSKKVRNANKKLRNKYK